MNVNHDPLLVYGANDAGIEIAEAATAAGWNVIGLLDEYTDMPVSTHWNLHHEIPQGHERINLIIGIDDNMARRRKLADLAQSGVTLVNILHPTAWVSTSAILGQGIYVGPHAVIQPGCAIDTGTLVSAFSLIEHHAHIFPFSSVAPRALVGARSMVGALTQVGAGATIKPGAHVVQGTVVEPNDVVEPDPTKAAAFEAA